jgi:hypothetical protein
MAFRDVVRGRVRWERLEALAVHLGERYDRDPVHVEFLDVDNWLSTPFVVDGELFVKCITPQNALVHGFITAGRNLGAVSSGRQAFFDHVGTPAEMADRERRATEQMRAAGLNAPEPVEAFDFDGMGVLVLEFLPAFETLDDVDDAALGRAAPALFDLLSQLHDRQLAHGDLRGENVLLSGDELYFIDATTVKPEGLATARAYDLASAMAVLAARIGAAETVAAAAAHYDADDLLAALGFLDFVNLRPDHAFDAAVLKGEIEKATT